MSTEERLLRFIFGRRVSRTDGALYSQPRTAKRRRRCDGHLVETHHIEVGEQAVWSSLPPENPEIGNDRWMHAVFCSECWPDDIEAGDPR